MLDVGKVMAILSLNMSDMGLPGVLPSPHSEERLRKVWLTVTGLWRPEHSLVAQPTTRTPAWTPATPSQTPLLGPWDLEI